MKITATLLIFVLSINSIFYYLSVQISFIKDKSEASFSIEHQQDLNKLAVIKTPLKNYQDNSESEIWNNGKLYDVVEKKLIHDTIYTYLYQDQNEQDLLFDLKTHFDNGWSSGNSKCFRPIHSTTDHLYFSTILGSSINPNSIQSIHTPFASLVPRRAFDVLDPPPLFI